MAYTESNMLPLGTTAPPFSLPDMVSGKTLTFEDVSGECGTVVMFLCNHCPYVLYVNPEIVKIAQEYTPLGIGFVGINSNDVENYPEDSPERMTQHAREVGYTFPYLFDESQEVAKLYDAACTPDFYVFDAQKKLIYRGQLDDSRPKRNPVPPSGRDLRRALDALLEGKPQAQQQHPSGGCNIKWKI